MPSVLNFGGFEPKIAENVFVASGAKIIGRVEIGANSSVWFNTVIRGDVAAIKIGKNTNIQDNCTIHVARSVVENGVSLQEQKHCVVGDNVSVGHNSILHACAVDEGTLIGMHSTVMDGAKIGKFCIVAAASLVTKNKIFDDFSLIAGSPAKFIRKLSENEITMLKLSAKDYANLASEYQKEQK